MRVRKPPIVLGLSLAGVAAFGLFAAWAFYATGKLGGGWSDLAPVWPFVLGGVAATALLAGALMWLAFFSADHGYDDGPDREDRSPKTPP